MDAVAYNDADEINLNDERAEILGEELFTALHSSKDRLYILKQNELLTKFMKSECVYISVPLPVLRLFPEIER